MTDTCLTMEHVANATRLVKNYLKPSPLIESPFLGGLTGARVWLKLESLQPTGSFKVRGALNRLATLPHDRVEKGVVAASAGNHALGVAFAARTLGLEHVTIFVPETCPQAKLKKLGRFEVDLRRAGRTYEDAHQAAAEYASRLGAEEISAYDDLEVIAGQSTIFDEILAELGRVDWIFVPVGGGGMIAGISYAAKQETLSVKVVGIQPEASPAALLSLRDGVAYDPYEHEPTIADGLAGGFGRLPLAIAGGLIDHIRLSSEEEIRQAVFALVSEEQIVAEPSGAIAIAPLLKSEFDLEGANVVCVISGGNLATSLLRSVISQYASV